MTNREIDEKIASLATRQHGVVTRQQLLALGLGRGGVHARTASGRMHIVHAGVYLVGHTARAPLALEMAAVLACGEGAAISHRSGASMWSLAHTFGVGQVEVTVPGRRSPRRSGVLVYRTSSLAANDVGSIEGIRVTSPARTVFDISRFIGVWQLEHVVADAERRGLVHGRELFDQLKRNRGRPGAATLRVVLDAEPAFTRSAAERKLLRLMRAASLPRPLTNVRVGRFEVDVLWPRECVVVEVDGFQWHADRTAFERDRVRDAELQALGYRVIRVTWRALQREPRAVVARIATTLRRASDLSSHG